MQRQAGESAGGEGRPAAVAGQQQGPPCAPTPIGAPWTQYWPACSSLTPVKAVPAKAQAKGSRYQGEMEMRYSASAKERIEVTTAPHARQGLSSNT